MQLTQKQESLISQYLRDAGRRLDSALSDQARERNLRQLQSQIYRELENLRVSQVSDADVLAVLRGAANHTARTAPPPAAGPVRDKEKMPANRLRPGPEDTAAKPVWLGVCAFNAERLGIEVWIVRLAAVVLGVAIGPLALVCYLAGFVEYYLTLDPRDRPPIAYGTLVLRAVGPLALLIVLRWGAGKMSGLIAYAHERFIGTPLPPIGTWDWLPYYNSTFFYLACLSVVPLGILSGMPLANAWGHSLKRLAQAIVALYAVILCFGLASILVGIILDRVEVYLQ